MRVLDAASGGLPYRVPYPDKAAAAEAVSETPVAEESPAAAKPLAAEESSLESDLSGSLLTPLPEGEGYRRGKGHLHKRCCLRGLPW